jgi:hypothetical protein
VNFPPSDRVLVSTLRGLLIAEICLFVIGLPLELFSSMLTDAYLQEKGIAMPESPDAGMGMAAFGCLFLVVGIPCLIVSWVGLFNFWGWARWLYLSFNVFGYLLDIPLAFYDFSFQWRLPAAVGDIGSLVTGAIAAIVFLSPIATRFSASNPPSPPQESP